MKKILLATTVLVGTAGFAAAEVTLSGDARMGLVNDGTDTFFSSRARVTFAMTGQTDGGLEFGATFRADNAGVAAKGLAGTVSMSGAFGKLSMGVPAGAADAAVGDLDGVGYTGLGDLSDTLYLTGDGAEAETIVQYAYTAGAISAYASTTSGGTGLDNYAVGVAYADDTFNAGLGYESSNDALGESVDATHIVGSVGGTFGAIAVKAVYGTADVDVIDVDLSQMGVSATYTMDALALTGYYKAIEADDGVASADASALGLGVVYDLGGGAAVKAGVVNYDVDADVAELLDIDNDGSVYDVGVTFKF